MHLVIIFGAAVRTGGAPSPALARRIAYGLIVARADQEAVIFCSGGVGRTGPSEASVMSRLLEPELTASRLILDEQSKSTFDTVVAAARLYHQRGFSACTACTDGYHLFRARALLLILGVRCAAGPVQSGLGGTSLSYWLRMRVREALAIPGDLIVMALRRRSLLDDFRRS